MFDRHLIPVIRSPLTRLARPLCRAGVSANQISLTGFAIGTLIGGVLQLAVQLPSLHRVGFRFRFDFPAKIQR